MRNFILLSIFLSLVCTIGCGGRPEPVVVPSVYQINVVLQPTQGEIQYLNKTRFGDMAQLNRPGHDQVFLIFYSLPLPEDVKSDKKVKFLLVSITKDGSAPEKGLMLECDFTRLKKDDARLESHYNFFVMWNSERKTK